MAFVTLAGTRNSSMGPPCRVDPTINRIISEHSYHMSGSDFTDARYASIDAHGVFTLGLSVLSPS